MKHHIITTNEKDYYNINDEVKIQKYKSQRLKEEQIEIEIRI